MGIIYSRFVNIQGVLYHVLLVVFLPSGPKWIIMKWVFYKRSKWIFHPRSGLNDNHTLSKNRFTRIKYGMLHVKSKVWLSRARDNDYSLKSNCDYAVSFVSEALVEEVKKMDYKSKSAKRLTTKTWYLGRVYKMHCKIGNVWIEYQQPREPAFQYGNKVMLVSK